MVELDVVTSGLDARVREEKEVPVFEENEPEEAKSMKGLLSI